MLEKIKMNTDDLNERYRKAQMSRLPDYYDGFDDGFVKGRMSMRWWLAAGGVVGFMWGIVIAKVML